MKRADKNRMFNDVSFLSGITPPRNWQNLKSLKVVAEYINLEFTKTGLAVEEQDWKAGGNSYRNIIASYNPDKQKRLVVGAHYDVCGDTPGADDNASGIAGLLESARIISQEKPDIDYRIDFVAYCLEEPPFFGGNEMGSFIHANSLKEQRVEVLGMICYEMIGYFSDAPNSQPNPDTDLAPDLPQEGNFIAIVGIEEHEEFNNNIASKMEENEEINTQLINLPANHAYAGLSDHINYRKFGYKAVMITDTATVRNWQHYHQLTDTLETLDFERMSEVVNSTCLAMSNFSE